jgi:hypothetical protein
MAKARGTFVVPRGFDPEAKRFATIVNDSIAQIKGEKGDPLDAAVTFRDLIDAGLAKRDIRIGANGRIIGGSSSDITIGNEEVFDIPPPPTGVSADGAFQNIIIEWDTATFFGFSHAEVWASSTNSFASRVFVGQTTAAVFSHAVGTGQTRYYWIRFVNTQDTPGPFNSTSGTAGTTALIDTQEIADGLITAAKLVDGAVTEVKIATDAVTNAKIAVNAIQGDVIAASAITETKISSNAISSAKIQANAIIAGKIATNAIVAGNIQSNAVTADKIQANAVNADKIAANSVTAAKMVAGTITAASGIIGDLAISSAKIIDGAIIRAKIGTAAIDDAKIANLSATKITSGQIDTARINVAGLITAGGLIVGSDLSTNGGTTIHGGNITTNTIAANKLTITPLEAGQAAADINSNTTTIDGGKITTNTVSATQINTTNLFLPSFGGEKTGTTLGYWNANDLNYRHVAEIGSGSGFYTGYIRVYKGSFAGQIKTISFLISDGTFGTSSSFNVNTSVTFSDTTKVLESASHAILVTPDLQYLSGGWIADSRLTTGKDSSNIPLSFRYTGSGTLNIFIYAQGDSNTQYMGGADARFVHFST